MQFDKNAYYWQKSKAISNNSNNKLGLIFHKMSFEDENPTSESKEIPTDNYLFALSQVEKKNISHIKVQK